jgi:hypothetical protein
MILMVACVLCLSGAAAASAAASPALVLPAGTGPRSSQPALGSAGAGVFSGRQAAGLRTPTVKAPEGTITPLKPSFKWSKVKGARCYDLRVYKGGALRQRFNGMRGTFFHVTKALPANATLVFKVRARNAHGASAWSKGTRFIISPPVPTSPAGTIASGSPTFEWGSLRGAARYDIEVAGGGQRLIESGLTTLSFRFGQELASNVPLTWKVRGSNADGVGVWSKSVAFTISAAPTADLTGLVISGAPADYSFAAGTYAYTGVTVLNPVAGITVTPTGSGTITVQGAQVASGSASDQIALTPGAPTTIAVVTTEAGKSAKTYTVQVTRNSGPAIGQSYGGGVVAYILQPDDPGYVGGQTHGLIAAAADQSAGTAWSNMTSFAVVTTGTALGTGQANTSAIVNQSGSLFGAARVCDDLTLNDYSDWYLPSKDELNELYLNRDSIGLTASGFWWSSSEYSAGFAWGQFDFGAQGFLSKLEAQRVRAVRSF